AAERRSLLRERLSDRLHRRNDRRTLLLFRRRLGRRRHFCGRRIVERMPVGDAADLIGVEDFTRQQRVGDVLQALLVLFQKRRAAIVLAADDALHFAVDLERRVFAVIGVLGDLAAEEDLLFLL